MALVGVEHLRRRVAGGRAVRADGPHPADADEDLLPDALVLVAAVEPVGDAAQVRLVLLDVGVEQQQRHPPDGRLPHPHAERAAGGHRDLDEDGLARGIGEQLQGQALRVERGVVLELPAVQRQRLAEVARPVQQPDADQRHAQVGRGLEVVAGQHPEAAGVVGQHLRDAELHREVADGGGQGRVVLALALVPAGLAQVGREVVGQLADRHHRLGVGRELREPGGRDLAEQAHGIVARAVPCGRVEGGEQVVRGRMPAPAQVGGQRLQRGQRGRELGPDGESAKGSHGR